MNRFLLALSVVLAGTTLGGLGSRRAHSAQPAAVEQAAPVQASGARPYFPGAQWERRPPADAGFDEALLNQAIAWAKAQETDFPPDFSAQEATFGKPLGPLPKTRAGVNGLIVRRGYIVAEFGDIAAVDPSYSIAKSYLATLLGLTIDQGLIGDVRERVGERIRDGGYDSPRNAKVTWAHHVEQTSEWEGELFGKSHTFLGVEGFGKGAMQPRELREPGSYYEYNDVRVNRLALSLLRLWKRPLPEVLKTEIMDPIGASSTWVYHAYDNAAVEIDGRPMKSVSGGTRWGAGLWMSTLDHARFGLLIARGGDWNGRRIISEKWVREAASPKGLNPGYGYLWWLNNEGRWPAAPRSSFAAVGAGNNTIWIDPEHDLVVVWRWHRGGDAQGEFYRRILLAIKPNS